MTHAGPSRAGRRILCLWNQHNPACAAAALELVEVLRREGHAVTTDAPAASVALGVDYVVLLGGDGFLMESLRLLDYPGAPVFGVNFGTVGFLMNTRSCLEGLPGLLREGAFLEEVHPVLEADVELEGGSRDRLLAFNDFVVERMTRQSIRLELSLDGAPFNHYAGDGFVLSTAAGSTAYNLAAGGPVVHPEIQGIVITPLYPHRAAPFHSVQFSIVVPLKSRLLLAADELPKRSMRVVADGRQLEKVARVQVFDSGRRVRLLRPQDHKFVKTLTRKFIGG